MTGPSFDDLTGGDVPPEERERLERVHELLLAAGPPAELAPELERGPTLAMTLARSSRRRGRRRIALLAAALTILALAFVGGFIAGNSGDGLTGTHTLQLTGTH
jgi:ferric-dicitrate binding protein FerR (iron transport regulator)